jgi:hypothetical protein
LEEFMHKGSKALDIDGAACPPMDLFLPDSGDHWLGQRLKGYFECRHRLGLLFAVHHYRKTLILE